MQKLRLTDVLEEMHDSITGMSSDDPRVTQLVNEAQRRLLKRGKWVGTTQRFKINATSGFITWPRQVETIEAFAICNSPGVIRNDWFEFVQNGYGLADCDDGWMNQLIDRDTGCTFDDIRPGATDSKLKVYSDLAEASTVRVVVQGNDENGAWIRTLSGSDYIDGESIAPSQAGTLSTKRFSAITGVYKDVTNGAVRIYEYDVSEAANVKAIAYYEPDETTPIYRRSLLPGIMQSAACCGEYRFVTVKVKLRYIRARNANDWIMLGDVDAIKLAVQAILLERKGVQGEAEGFWGKAVTELDHAMRSYYGDGAVAVPRFQAAAEWGGGGIPALH